MAPADRELAVEAISRNSRALVHQVNGLMDESMQSMRAELLRPLPTDLHSVAREIIADYQGLNPRVGIELVGEPLWAIADAGALDTVLRHLTENALRYARDHVRIEVRPAGEYAVVAVSDDGPGLPKGLTLFQAFAPAADGSGHGLGLHVVKTLVDAMAGEVSGRNAQEGGAVFEVRLRLSAPGG